MSSEIRTRQPRLRRLRLSSGAILLSLPAFLLVVALFIYPFLYGVLLSFRGGYVGEGGWTLANYRDFFGNSYLAGTIGVTFQVSANSCWISSQVQSSRTAAASALITSKLCATRWSMGTAFLDEG